MSNEVSSFDELDEFNLSELTEKDLAILQAFEAMDTWSTGQSLPATNDHNETPKAKVSQPLSPHENEEMILIFITEAEEDISSLRQLLNQLEQDELSNTACFITMKRAGHKLHGTAGAVGFSLISTIAAQVEILAEGVSRGQLSARTGTLVISAATIALEACLETITSTHQEPEAASLLASLETAYRSLHIDLQQLEQEQTTDQIDSRADKQLQSTAELRSHSAQATPDKEVQEPLTSEGSTIAVHISSEDPQQGSPPISSMPLLHVDARRFEHLAVYTEKLVEQRTTVEDAQRQVECALQELYTAQARLQRLEPLISQLPNEEISASSLREYIPASSLVARILHESLPPHRRHQKHSTSLSNRKLLSASEHMNTNLPLPANAQWDELELENYNKQDMIRHTLKEAIADITITTANVQSAFAHFSIIQQDCLTSITQVYRDTLLLRQAAFATIVPRLERVVTMSAPGQAQQIHFEVTGAEMEIDQELLNTLATPLVQLLRTCLADPVVHEELTTPIENESSRPPRVWLKVTNYGKRLTFEIGFSMPIRGGAIETIRQPIEQLHGTISLQRNSVGGISFFLHVPHIHSSVSCLLVQAGDQHLFLPFNQIHRISTEEQEQTDVRYSLQELLGFSGTEPRTSTSLHLPLLLLSSEDGTMRGSTGIVVNEILGEQECIVKPLPTYLQRPGIAGTTIDGEGRVLLMVDLLALIRSAPQYSSSHQTDGNPLPRPDRAKILITDDSATLRHSLMQTLQKASYTVFEAHDGVAALEKLERHKPDICLLDIEMPNLNGYDVLQIMSANPVLSTIRVIILTSRAATKHMQHALELGARAYLTKPCTQDDLFQTIEHVMKK